MSLANLGLPPLNALVVFEAAARMANFSRAGAELGLTQSAVSRQMLKLEGFIGAKLFLRTPTGVTLTPVGEAYVAEVRRILGELATVTHGVRGSAGPRQVTLACSHGIADLWLMPRLQALDAALPGIELRLRVTDDVARLRLDEFDLAIFYRREKPTGVALHVLGTEEIVPVTAPGRAPLAEDPAPTLLAIEDSLREWLDWPHWFSAVGRPLPPEARVWRLGSYALAVQAASQGLGTTLGWTWLLRDRLAAGTLVPAHDFHLRSEGSFYLMRPLDRHVRRVVRQLMDWLVASNAG
jgi:DNA-binding transcriptional LysR family regulator